MAFSEEEFMELGSSNFSPEFHLKSEDTTATSTQSSMSAAEQLHFSRRHDDEGKNEKNDDEEDEGKKTFEEEDVYERTVPLELYTKFLGHCMQKEFDEAILLSQEILKMDPNDATIQQYIPVLEAHIQLQEEEDEEDDDDDDDDDDGEDDDDDLEEDDDDEEGDEEVEQGGRRQVEGKESESKVEDEGKRADPSRQLSKK